MILKLTMENNGCGNCNSTFKAMHWIKRKKGKRNRQKGVAGGGEKGNRRDLFIYC